MNKKLIILISKVELKENETFCLSNLLILMLTIVYELYILK